MRFKLKREGGIKIRRVKNPAPAPVIQGQTENTQQQPIQAQQEPNQAQQEPNQAQQEPNQAQQQTQEDGHKGNVSDDKGHVSDDEGNVSDDQGTKNTAEECEILCANLSRQYQELITKDLINFDEDDQLAHFQSLSDIQQRLEVAQTNLTEERSRLNNKSASDVGVNLSTKSIEELESSCADLSKRLQELFDERDASVFHNEEDQLNLIQAISDVNFKLESTQMSLMEARSRARESFGGNGSGGSPSEQNFGGEGPSTSYSNSNENKNISELQQEYNALCSVLGDMTNTEESTKVILRISEIEGILSSAQQAWLNNDNNSGELEDETFGNNGTHDTGLQDEICVCDKDWALPLSMTNKVDLLEQSLSESQRKCNNE